MLKLIRTKQPFSNILTKITKRFSYDKQARQQVSRQMNEKIEIMKQSIAKSTPRSFSLLFLVTSVPAFLFINELMEKQYNDPQFTSNSHKFYKYYYLCNLIFLGCGIALTKFNFHSPSSQYTLPKTPMKTTFIPLLLSFVGLLLPQANNKHYVWPAVVTQISTMFIEGTMVNKGFVPFWFYSHRHYIGLFYFVMFAINYKAMSRWQMRRKSHKHQFLDVVE